MGSADFVSDLIVWEADFVSVNPDLQKAFNDLARDKEVVRKYITEKGIAPDQIVFEAVNTNEQQEINIKTAILPAPYLPVTNLDRPLKLNPKTLRKLKW